MFFGGKDSASSVFYKAMDFFPIIKWFGDLNSYGSDLVPAMQEFHSYIFGFPNIPNYVPRCVFLLESKLWF